MNNEFKDYHRRVADGIKRLREERGLGQEELCKKAKMGLRSVGLIETHGRRIGLDTLLRLSAALDVQPHDILPRL